MVMVRYAFNEAPINRLSGFFQAEMVVDRNRRSVEKMKSCLELQTFFCDYINLLIQHVKQFSKEWMSLSSMYSTLLVGGGGFSKV